MKEEKYIEIVSSASAMGALKSIGIEINNIIELPIYLSIGKLENLEIYSRIELKNYNPIGKYTLDFTNYSFKEKIIKMNYLLKNNPNIRVWSSHLNADEYLLLMYICYLYPNTNISVLYSEEISYNLKSIGEMNSRELLELMKKQHNLRKEDIIKLSNRFIKILKDNAEVRIIKGSAIENSTINSCSNIILKELNHKFNKNEFIGKLIGNDIIPGANHDFYEFFINYLIEQNKICLLENKSIKCNI